MIYGTNKQKGKRFTIHSFSVSDFILTPILANILTTSYHEPNLDVVCHENEPPSEIMNRKGESRSEGAQSQLFWHSWRKWQEISHEQPNWNRRTRIAKIQLDSMITLLFIEKLPSNKQMKRGRELCIDHHQSKHVFYNQLEIFGIDNKKNCWIWLLYMNILEDVILLSRAFLNLHKDLTFKILHII